jgi:flavin-dependent thymidylate synthase
MTEMQKWGDDAMYQSEPMAEKGPQVYLLSATPDPLGAIAAAAKMYKGEVVRDLSTVTDDERRHFWGEMKKTHLQAPLEFVDFHFMIEGVTRSFTHQMVRQRTAVYAQESLRFAVKEDLAAEVPLPPSLSGEDPDAAAADVSGEPMTRQEMATDAWTDAISTTERAYRKLIDLGIPAEDARGLLPHSVTTRLNYKTNLRNLLEHAGNRLCTQAQFEWRIVFAKLVESIRNYDPIMARFVSDAETSAHWEKYSHDWQFQLIAGDDVFRPVCFRLGHCPFTADFDRKCSIRERVQEGRWEEIKDAEWLLNPAAAR